MRPVRNFTNLYYFAFYHAPWRNICPKFGREVYVLFPIQRSSVSFHPAFYRRGFRPGRRKWKPWGLSAPVWESKRRDFSMAAMKRLPRLVRPWCAIRHPKALIHPSVASGELPCRLHYRMVFSLSLSVCVCWICHYISSAALKLADPWVYYCWKPFRNCLSIHFIYQAAWMKVHPP